MKSNVRVAAQGLLSSLSKVEVDELIEVLKHFNDRCEEKSRAACLEVGCQGDPPPERIKKALTESATGGSSNIYMGGGQSVCPCCKK